MGDHPCEVECLHQSMIAKTLDEYCRFLQKDGHIPSAANFQHYCPLLFRDIDLRGKSVLDIGGGMGIFSFYCGLQGASDVLCLEPETDGSSAGMVSSFRAVQDEFGLHQVRLRGDLFQKFDAAGKLYDVVLLHHSINHLDEDACIHLRDSAKARDSYGEIAKKMAQIMPPGGTLILADCSPSNVFNDLGIQNPMMKSIEWHKHQPPEAWTDVFRGAGFDDPKVTWTSFNTLRELGFRLFGNRVAAYLTLSHFILHLKRR